MKFVNAVFRLFALFILTTLLLLACTLDPMTPTCLNDGTYNENTGECDCPPEYTGEQCEEEVQVDPCDSITCLNGGTCVDGQCDCPPEYTGEQCEEEIQVDPCDSITCLNDGVCVDGQCDCPEGWTGTDCSEPEVTMTTISPAPAVLCPTQISGANANFYTNGPLVNISINLSVINSNEMYANIVFELEQTATNNPTIGYAEKDVLIYTAPAGKQIAEITGDPYCAEEYTDTDFFLDIVEPEDCTMVDRFEVYGDTSGNDFGDCNTDNDSKLTVHFNFIEIGLINE